jgi:YD repeat-containing protein
MKFACRILVLASLLSIAAGSAFAQVQPGTPPFASISGGPDKVNLANLNVHQAFPVFHKPGRGLPFNFDLTFDSDFWQPIVSGSTKFWSPGVPICNTSGQCTATGGWSGSPVNVGTFSYTVAFDSEFFYFCNFVYYDGFGAGHVFAGCAAYDYIFGLQYPLNSSAAVDDSGYTVTANPNILDNQPVVYCQLFSADGSQIIPQSTAPLAPGASAGSVIDRNGNEITANADGTFTDTLGMTALSTSGSAVSPPLTYTYTSPSGAPTSVVVSFQSYTIQTNFQCSGIAEYGPIKNIPLVDRITLPDGTFYHFQYEPTPGGTGNYTGRVASVTLPTGGTISYSYAAPNDGINCADGSAMNLTRTTPDGVWTYTRTIGTGAASTTTITDPQTDVTKVQFQGIYETERQVENGPSSLVQTITTCYNGNNSNCPATAITLPILRRTVFTQWAAGSKESERDMTYSNLGLELKTDEYDYGPSAPGALLRDTVVVYQPFTGNPNLSSFPQTVTVNNGSLNMIARTSYFYDQGTPTSTCTPTCLPQHVAVGSVRGNLTTLTRLVQGSTSVSRTTTYFDTGEVQTANDFDGNPTKFLYSDTYAGAYPTTVTNALNQSTMAAYDSNTGVVTSSIDLNGLQTSFTYDDMMRPLTATYPDGGLTTYTYTNGVQVQVTQKIDNSNTQVGNGLLDGLGRPLRVAVTNGETPPYDQVDICYNSLGLPGFQSYPYQGPGLSGSPVCSGAGDSFTYDALYRTTKVTHSDNSVISIAFSDPCATATDEQSKMRKSCGDGLGRLSTVNEDPNGLNYLTSYTYDALNDMTGVTQAGSRSRTFAYDGLARLTSSMNPESSYSATTQASVATTYVYDPNGNLIGKVEPAQNQQGTSTVALTFCYDALNRLTAKGYSAQTCANGLLPTPVATYIYDGNPIPSGLASVCSVGSFNFGLAIGMRTAMCDQAGTGSADGAEAWGYSLISGMGWQVTDRRITYGVTKSASYQYNHLNSLVSAMYPSGRVVNYAYNVGNRPISAMDGTTGASYASTVHYWAGGAQCWAVIGGVITSAQTFNARLQPNTMQASGSLISYPGSCSGLGQTGGLIDLAYNFDLASGDNGNVMGITRTVGTDTSRSQTFTYESLNRLSTAATTSVYSNSPTHCWGESYGYDAWTNLLSITPMTGNYTNCTQESGLSVTMSSQNRISTNGYLYDTPGNLMSVSGVGSYTFNAENQMTQASGSSADGYVYDGDGKRVQKTSGGTPFKIYWYDTKGEVLDETDQTGNTSNTSFNEYIYFGGKKIALLAGQ